MTRTRPPATVKDSNHYIPRDYLRDRCGGFEVVRFGRTLAYCANHQGYRFILFDMSNFGGVYPDWLLTCGRQMRWLEIKTEAAAKKADHDLTDGEKWLRENSEAFWVVVTDDAVELIMQQMVDKASLAPERSD